MSKYAPLFHIILHWILIFFFRFSFVSARVFHNGLPVKNELAENKVRRAGNQVEAVVLPEQPAFEIGPISENEFKEPEREPAIPKKKSIPSSTMCSVLIESENSIFDDVSMVSSSVPTVSSGTMRLLAPIIEAALAEDVVEQQLTEENPTPCQALVPYCPLSAMLAFQRYRHNASFSQEDNESTPPASLKPIPSLPKKPNMNEGDRLSILTNAIRRLDLNADDKAKDAQLWEWRSEQNVTGAENTVAEINYYENIASPENFED